MHILAWQPLVLLLLLLLLLLLCHARLGLAAVHDALHGMPQHPSNRHTFQTAGGGVQVAWVLTPL
jgi:hypothetical protein